MSVEQDRARRLAHRIPHLARAEEDVGGHVDRGDARVAPRRPKLGLRVNGDGLSVVERVAVADPPPAPGAQHAALVEAVDLVQAPLRAPVALNPPAEEAVAQPAAPEEHGSDTAPLKPGVAAAAAAGLAVQTALVAAHEPLAGAAASAHHPQA